MSSGHHQPRELRGKGWCVCEGQDWDTEGQDKGMVQLTGHEKCSACSVHQDGAGRPGKGERNQRTNVGERYKTLSRRPL